jgi:hypothetical protein
LESLSDAVLVWRAGRADLAAIPPPPAHEDALAMSPVDLLLRSVELVVGDRSAHLETPGR